MKKLSVLILLISILALVSCQKEIVQPTRAEQTASASKEIIQSQKIERVVAVGLHSSASGIASSVGLTHSFSKGFITISGYMQSFNPTYLQAYSVENILVRGDNGNTFSSRALVLYFQF